jgi:hypothetical protein
MTRGFNASTRAIDESMTLDSFRGLVVQTEPMPIWMSFDYVNDALQAILAKDDFKAFEATEWVVRPYGSNRFDFVIAPRAGMGAAYKPERANGESFAYKMEALRLAFEANYRYGQEEIEVADGQKIKGRGITKTFFLKDDGDHSEPNYVTGVGMPWDPNVKMGTDDPEWATKFIRLPEALRLPKSPSALGITGPIPGAGVTIGILDTGLLPHPTIWSPQERTDSRAPGSIDFRRAANFVPTRDTALEKLMGHFDKKVPPPEGWTRASELPDDIFPALDPFTFHAAPANPGHGTAVATILLGRGANATIDASKLKSYVLGMVPGATIVPVRVGPSTVVSNPEPLTEGYKHLTPEVAPDGKTIRAGADVITVSLGGVPDVKLHDALIEAYKAGVILTAAAGNGFAFVVWPAAYREVIAVGAGSITCKPWGKTSPGSKVEILSPGDEVWYGASFLDKRGYAAHARPGETADAHMRYSVKRGQGTSFATPHVAGAAALWLSHHGGADAIRAHYAKQKGKVNDHRYVSLAFRWLLANETELKDAQGVTLRARGHTQCPGIDGAANGRNASGRFLNVEALLSTKLEHFPTKAELDAFEKSGMRSQKAKDLVFTGVITATSALPTLLSDKDFVEDGIQVLPPAVREEIVRNFNGKIFESWKSDRL